MDKSTDDAIAQDLEHLELQTLQGFWRIEKILEEIHREQMRLTEEIRLLRSNKTADLS